MHVEGATAPAAVLLAAALAQDRTAIFLASSQDAAEQAVETLDAFRPRVPSYLAGHSPAFLEEGASPATTRAVAERVAALDCLAAGRRCLVLATPGGLLQHTFSPDEMRGAVLDLAPGSPLELDPTLHHLVRIGYERVEVVQQPGEFAARGGILDIFPANSSRPVRIDLFGDEIESVRTFDPISQRSTGSLRSIRILPACEPAEGSSATMLDFLSSDAVLIVEDAGALRRRWDEFQGEVRDQIAALLAGQAHDADAASAQPLNSAGSYPFLSLDQAIPRLEKLPTVFLNPVSHTVPWGKAGRTLPLICEPPPHFDGDIAALAARARGWQEHEVSVWLFSHQWPRLTELLQNQGVADVTVAPGGVVAGFFMPGARMVVLSDREIFGGLKLRRPVRTFRNASPLSSLAELKAGDLVVHIDHGIGRFQGLRSMEVEGVRRDYLHLEYAQGDKLFVPSDQINRIQRYIGAEEHAPVIHRLGGADWARTKRKVRESVEQMAKELVALYAARSRREGHAFGPDTPWQQEVEDAFVYDETPDQLRAIEDVKGDLESEKPMDRLICGDVGYGKTEVAIRASFKVVMEGMQVAVLVPTTVLAQQHFNTFTERLSGFPVKIEMLSRFRSRKEQQATVEGLKEGRVDIVIGTHRLLSKDVAFKNLGLVVVDEEQRFGVGHKEKLKQLRQMVDVLTLTATPIPRTLHMAVSTIRDMSVMNQAPEGRTPIRTYLREFSEDLVRQAILRELERDGQVYFVHNRVESLPHVAETLRKLVPQARVAVGHGQMPEQSLEPIMLDFYEGQYDVLCCTTIIESGLDIPNVNTILVDNADQLGLAQLYQLRGRVGRSNRQAYCYLLFRPNKEITEVAQKRLEALREFTDLGSGLKIAMRDLEIRGAGNLLGAEQSGAMMSVGFELYCQMIADAVRTLRNEPPPAPPLPPVDLPIAAFISSEYIGSESLRIEFYKRLSAATTAEEMAALQEELQDRFGQIPPPVRNMLAILRLRLQCRRAGASAIVPEKDQVVIRLTPRARLMPPVIASLQARHRGVRFLADRVVVPIGARGALGPVSEILDSLESLRRRAAQHSE